MYKDRGPGLSPSLGVSSPVSVEGETRFVSVEPLSSRGGPREETRWEEGLDSDYVSTQCPHVRETS